MEEWLVVTKKLKSCLVKWSEIKDSCGGRLSPVNEYLLPLHGIILHAMASATRLSTEVDVIADYCKDQLSTALDNDDGQGEREAVRVLNTLDEELGQWEHAVKQATDHCSERLRRDHIDLFLP